LGISKANVLPPFCILPVFENKFAAPKPRRDPSLKNNPSLKNTKESKAQKVHVKNLRQVIDKTENGYLFEFLVKFITKLFKKICLLAQNFL